MKCVLILLRIMNQLDNEDPKVQLAIRVDESNPNHHLWNNNGTWWLHYTVYPTPVTSERRRSLFEHEVSRKLDKKEIKFCGLLQ